MFSQTYADCSKLSADVQLVNAEHSSRSVPEVINPTNKEGTACSTKMPMYWLYKSRVLA